MKKNTSFFILIVVAMAVVGCNQQPSSDTQEQTFEQGGNATTGGFEVSQSDGDAETTVPSGGDSETVPSNGSGGYVEYKPDAVAQATADGGRAVLFFHASWCPTCQAANADITSRLSEIPSDLTIIKTDYDTYTDLKKKYGVTYQHTFIQVDSEGNALKKWNGGLLDDIIEQVI